MTLFNYKRSLCGYMIPSTVAQVPYNIFQKKERKKEKDG
jgi:hypothetical protein